MNLITCKGAAEVLGVSDRRIRAMIKSGLLKGRKLGAAWLIDMGSVGEVMGKDRKPGRPKTKPA